MCSIFTPGIQEKAASEVIPESKTPFRDKGWLQSLKRKVPIDREENEALCRG
jgi:hypothetical protein